MIQRELDLPQSDTLSSERVFTVAEIDEMHRLRRSHQTPVTIGRKFRLTSQQVRALLGEPPHCVARVRYPDFDHELARQERAAGAKIVDIARRHGVSEYTAKAAVRGVVCPVDHRLTPDTSTRSLRTQSPQYREKMRRQREEAARLKAERFALRAQRAAGVIPVPAWVPAPLRSTFENVAWIRGECEAASVCRAMKRGLRP